MKHFCSHQHHKGVLCPYCLKLYNKVGGLESHLKTDHNIAGRYYSSPKQFLDLAGKNYTLICSIW